MPNSFVHVHLVALRYFAETVRTRSMRAAAEHMNVAPSAVNRQILKLEDQLQCKLFHRNADGVRLTAAGEVLYHYTLRLEHDLERTIATIDDLRGLRRGHIRIACEDGIGRDFVAPLLARFHERYPRVTYYVEVCSALDVLEQVAQGLTDIGMAMSPPTRSDVFITASEEIPLGVISPPGSALSQKPVVSMRDLFEEQLVQAKEGTGGGVGLSNRMASGLTQQGVVETNAPDLITALVQNGLGTGFRTAVGILQDIELGRIAFTPLEDKRAKSPHLCVYTQPGRNLPNAGAVLLELIRETLPVFRERVVGASGLDRADAASRAEAV